MLPDGWKEIKFENEEAQTFIPVLRVENWLGLEFYLWLALVFLMMEILRRNLEKSFCTLV